MITRFLIATGIHPVLVIIAFAPALWFVLWLVLGIEFRFGNEHAARTALWITLADVALCLFMLMLRGSRLRGGDALDKIIERRAAESENQEKPH